jgi:hypothetical protein
MSRRILIAVLVALVAAGLAYWFWPRSAEPPPPPATPADSGTLTPLPPPPAAAASPAASAASAAEMPASAPEPLAADDQSVREALVALLGKPAVLTLLQTDRFAQRVVATVDNLPRGHAAPRLWPVNPTPGRFSVDASGHIDPGNAKRYDALVEMITQLSPAAAAQMYRRLEPQLQTAYEDLGYPGRRFHDRLLETLDHLLGTPTLTGAPAVTLTDVKGPIPSERPWVRYEYADPGLEALSAGQKILLRIGPAHQRRLMDWLRQFRDQIRR